MTAYPPGVPAAHPTVLMKPVMEVGVKRPNRGRLLWFGALGAGLAFVALAVGAYSTPYFPVDLEITRALQAVHSPWIEAPFRALNAFGFAPIVTIAFAFVVLLLLVVGRRWEAVSAGFATLGAAGLTEVVKGLVGRPRPSADLVHVAHHIDSSGFPAGHVMNFTPFVGFLCYLAYVRLAPSWRRTALIALLLILIAMMGPARIYNGEHWPSDVLGSYLLGIVWLIASIALYEGGIRRKRRQAA